MKNVNSIMIVGVGGQGTLLASRILGNILMNHGYDVKVSEVHGMAQRGGSVVTYVKYGDRVYSPVVEQGEADVILAFELCEAARWVSYLKQGGKLIVNTQRIDPMPVITGAAEYPQGVVEKIRGAGVDVLPLDALSIAEEAGSAKATNVALIGALSCYMGFPAEEWERVIGGLVPPRFLEVNRKAFRLGRTLKVEG